MVCRCVKDHWVSVLTFLLAIVAVAYQGRGFYHMMFVAEPNLCDLRQRWEEQQSVLKDRTRRDNGKAAMAPSGKNSSTTAERNGRKIRNPSSGGYPPWAFFTGMLFLSASWPVTRVTFAAWNAFATVVIGVWAYYQGRPHGLQAGLLSACAVLAINAFCNSLVVGQYGTLVVALVIAAELAYRRQRHGISGLLIGVAMIKPTVAAPLVLPFVVRAAWKPLVVAALYLVVGTGVVYVMTEINPIEMCAAMVRAGAQSTRADNGVAGLMWQSGMNVNWILPILVTCGIGLLIVTIVRYRKMDPLVLFAVCCVIGRVCTYHRKYDNVMLVFLLVALSFAACGPNRSLLAKVGFLMCGISLWLPVRFLSPQVQTIQMGVWLVSLCVFLVVVKRDGFVLSGLSCDPHANQARPLTPLRSFMSDTDV